MTEDEIIKFEREAAAARLERAEEAHEKILRLENDAKGAIEEIAAHLPANSTARRAVESLFAQIGNARITIESFKAELAKAAAEPVTAEPTSGAQVLPVPSAV